MDDLVLLPGEYMADILPPQLIRPCVTMANIWEEMLMLYALVCKTIPLTQLPHHRVLQGFE